MDDAELFARLLRGLAHEQRLLGTHADGGRLIERAGMVGAIVASVPESSLANAVVLLEPAALDTAGVDDLRRAYAEAGVRKWGVWLDPRHADALAALSSAGLVFDSRPTAMGAALADLDLDGAAPAEAIAPREAGRVNDLAYGHADGRLERMLGGLPEDAGHTYAMRDAAGEPVSVATIVEHDGDAAVWMVATVPWARHQGHARRLMRRGLLEARERGCTTTTLLASALGAPVYRGMGYRTLGELHLWEQRP